MDLHNNNCNHDSYEESEESIDDIIISENINNQKIENNQKINNDHVSLNIDKKNDNQIMKTYYTKNNIPILYINIADINRISLTHIKCKDSSEFSINDINYFYEIHYHNQVSSQNVYLDLFCVSELFKDLKFLNSFN